MPGLKALSDQLPAGRTQQRGATYYTAVFGLGSGLSILIGGYSADLLDWRWAFIVAGAGSLGALAIIAIVLPSSRPTPSGSVLDFRPVLRDRAVMGYILSFFGIAWEVFTSRIWLVTFFVFLAAGTADNSILLSPAAWATIVALVGPPSAMIIGELAMRIDRRRLLISVAAISLMFTGAIGLTMNLRYEIPLILCVLFGAVSYGRNAATVAGTIALANPARRGVTLAVQAFIGFSGGVLGPLAFGFALDGFDSVPVGWLAALSVMAIGPLLSILFLAALRR